MFTKPYQIHLLLTLLFSFHPVFSMELPLCTEEKELFLWAIELAANEVGWSIIKEHLDLAEQNKDPIHVSLKFYSTDVDENPFIKDIYEQIILKDEAFGYIPDSDGENESPFFFNGNPTNYLGNYTRYWHKENEYGPYIKCRSKFTNIALLQEALTEKK